MRPRMFIASSSEGLKYAEALERALAEHAEVVVWNKRLYRPSQAILEDLVNSLDDYDFGVFVFAPDDEIRIRGKLRDAVRDNVIFECGLFIGRHGRERVFIVRPDKLERLHLPEDFLGILGLVYDKTAAERNALLALAPAALRIQDSITQLGLTKSRAAGAAGQLPGQVAAICYRYHHARLEFLLVSSTRSRRIFPKGRVAARESLTTAALRYAHQEGGVMGQTVSDEPFIFRYFKEEDQKEYPVAAILVEVTSTTKVRAKFRDPRFYVTNVAEEKIMADREFLYADELRRVLSLASSHLLSAPHRRIQSAVLPFRIGDSGLEILLITSRTRGRWIIPKGNIKSGATAQESAAAEALEEAGVEGNVRNKLVAHYSYSRMGSLYDVDVFAMEVQTVHPHWPEEPYRKRSWMSPEKAASLVEYEQLKGVIVDFVEKSKDLLKHRDLFS